MDIEITIVEQEREITCRRPASHGGTKSRQFLDSCRVLAKRLRGSGWITARLYGGRTSVVKMDNL